jgi:CheY-like chemotaxis protein
MAVDGDGVVFMNTVLMFEDLLHTVLEASSGEEALRLLVQGRFPTPDY